MSSRMIVFSGLPQALAAERAIFAAVRKRFPEDAATRWGAPIELTGRRWGVLSPAAPAFEGAGLSGPALALEASIARRTGGQVLGITEKEIVV